jgi:serine/threonine-protein kinase HipA
MSVNGKFKGFEVNDLLEEAERFKIGTAKDIIQEVRSSIQQWPIFANKAGLPQQEITDRQNYLLMLE